MTNSSSPGVAPNLLQTLDASVWVIVLRLAIASNGVCSNLFLCALFARFPRLRSSQCDKLILLNAVMDLLTALGPLTRGALQLFLTLAPGVQLTRATCLGVNLPYKLGLPAGQVTFLALAFDRLTAIARPFHYQQQKKRAFFLSVAFCAIAADAVFVALSLVANDLRAPSDLCTAAANFGPLYNVYWPLFNTAVTVAVFALYVALLLLFLRSSAKSAPSNSAAKRAELRLTLSVVLILSNYALCWALPMLTWSAFSLLDPTNTSRMGYVSYVLGFTTAAGGGVNLYIYLAKHAEIGGCARTMLFGQETGAVQNVVLVRPARGDGPTSQ